MMKDFFFALAVFNAERVNCTTPWLLFSFDTCQHNIGNTSFRDRVLLPFFSLRKLLAATGLDL
jgi:hypothetical protein